MKPILMKHHGDLGLFLILNMVLATMGMELILFWSLLKELFLMGMFLSITLRSIV